VNPHQLAAQVRAIPGVAQVFPAASTVAELAGSVRHGTAPRESVELTTTASRTELAVRIAVGLEHSTADTARRVADLLVDSAPPDSGVTVRIAHIA